MIRDVAAFARAVWNDVLPLLRAWVVLSAVAFAVIGVAALVAFF